MAYALAKFTFRLNPGAGSTLIKAEPLFHDIRDPETKPRLLPGSEFWPFREQTDVVVRGSAWAAGRRPIENMQVAVSVGQITKRIQVFGRRVMDWRVGGRPQFSNPEPFTEMPVIWENAYGGADRRVPVGPEPLTVGDIERLQADHPGMYPRNPLGKGYVVVREPVTDVELPNLEDPDDLLTPERVVVGDPKLWYRQPLPMSFGYTYPIMFPRLAYLGLDAWFTPPQDASLTEVRKGWLPANYRQLYGSEMSPAYAPPPAYHQEASLGMTFPNLAPGTPIVVRGMHPTQSEVRFAIPSEPRIAIEIEGQRQNLKPLLCNVLVEPALEKVSLVYIVRTEKMPRVFIAGIHGHIPLSVIIQDDEPVVYDTPPTIRQRIQAGA
ncbi:MAG TPA: DUF2169 domain-containing protein [Phycisphaerae bacterium]|nr:DUF2169 domain-containing protein [Phycisphaerae bacterium]